jgi:hypoxanthine phosphoribosyltransferase
MILNVVITILTVLGSLASIGVASRVILEGLGFFSWLGVTYRAKLLIGKIRGSDYSPDVVIGLGRSGAILGGIIAGNLGVKLITVIDRRYDWSSNRIRTVVPVSFLDPQKIKGKKVLLVDAAPSYRRNM